jgi:hypothetical protein
MRDKTIVDEKGVEWHKDRHPKDMKHHTFNVVLSAFNVGEVRKSIGYKNYEYYYFSFANKIIFTSSLNYKGELIGLHRPNYDFLIR